MKITRKTRRSTAARFIQASITYSMEPFQKVINGRSASGIAIMSTT
jgi:hypothetical protein